MEQALGATNPYGRGPLDRRRAGPRVAMTTAVDVFVGPEAIRTASLDIGLGGLCIELPDSVGLGGAIRVCIYLGGSHLELQAALAWRRPTFVEHQTLVGLRFVELEAEQTTMLWETLHRRALTLARFLVEGSALVPIDVDIALDLTLRTRRRHFPVGSIIYRQGESVEGEGSIFIVANGEVELLRETPDGERIPLAKVEQGQVFGGLPIVADVEHIDAALAASELQLLEIDRYSLQDLRAEKPLVAHAVERAVVRRHVSNMEQLLMAIPRGHSND